MSTAVAIAPTDDQTRKIMKFLRQGRPDGRIAKRLGISREEVRATIHGVIDAARLDDQATVASLALQVGIATLDAGDATPGSALA